MFNSCDFLWVFAYVNSHKSGYSYNELIWDVKSGECKNVSLYQDTGHWKWPCFLQKYRVITERKKLRNHFEWDLKSFHGVLVWRQQAAESLMLSPHAKWRTERQCMTRNTCSWLAFYFFALSWLSWLCRTHRVALKKARTSATFNNFLKILSIREWQCNFEILDFSEQQVTCRCNPMFKAATLHVCYSEWILKLGCQFNSKIRWKYIM